MNDPREPNPKFSGLRTAGYLLAIPGLLIVAPLVGFFAGRWLDGRFGTLPWLSLAATPLWILPAALLAAWHPAARASRRPIAQAVREE